MRIRFHREARSGPDVIDGLKVPYAAAKRNAPKWRWYLILAVVLSPALWLLVSTAQSMLSWTANGSVFLEPYELRAPSSARVAAVGVRVGAEVAAGDVLVTLHDPDLEAAIADVRASMSAVSAPARSDSNLLHAELEIHRRSLQRQEERRAAIAELLKEGAATAAELREAQIAVDQTAATVLRLQQQIAPGSGRASTDAAIDERQRTLDRLLAKRDRLTVRAPVSGRVLDVVASDGEFVGAGESLLSIGRVAQPTVIAYVSPDISPKLTVGSRATIRFPDGSKAPAFVAEQPMLTQRMPSDLVNQFGLRPMTVVLHLQTARAWPEGQRIHGLPVMVRFRYAWEPQRGERFAGEPRSQP